MPEGIDFNVTVRPSVSHPILSFFSLRSGVYLFRSLCLSVRSKYFRHILLRSYWWQPLDFALTNFTSVQPLVMVKCEFSVTFFWGTTQTALMFRLQPHLGVPYSAYGFHTYITRCQVPSRVRAWFHDSADDIYFYQISLSQSELTIIHQSII